MHEGGLKTSTGASRLSKFWIFFGAIQRISCRDWWPWTKPGYITMTRRQSNNQWSGGIAAQPCSKKFLVQQSARKVLASIFWDQDGVLLIDYLPKGQTINAEYYSSLLVQLKDILKEKRRGKFTKDVVILHDNDPAHRALTSPEETGLPGLPISWSPPYSPDLAPSDYHLFSGLEKQLKCRHFSSDTEVIAAAETWLDGQYSDFFFEWLGKVRARAKKFIELRGEYIE